MSWAEVSKINNDFSMPINLAMLINHIDLIGNDYNPLLDFENTKSLLGAEVTYSHKIASSILSKGFWDYVLNGGSTNVGRDINQAFKIGRTDFEQYSTVADLFGEPERAFTVAKYGGRSALVSSFLSNLLDYNGFVSGMLSTYRNTLMLYNSIKDESILPINAIRNSTIAFEELHSSEQLVLLDTVGEGTYVIPDGVTSILVAAISGGGGGAKGGVDAKAGDGGDGGGTGGTYVKNINYASGGGGGAYRMHVVQVSPGQSYPYVVGDGGEAATNGEASRFNDIQGERFIEQKYVLPNSSTGGSGLDAASGAAGGNGGDTYSLGYGGYGGGGGGGYGGGNGTEATNSQAVGKGGLTYGDGGGGISGGGFNTSYLGGGGGGGYGGGGGGSTANASTSAEAGKGGQGIIALYLGREAYIA